MMFVSSLEGTVTGHFKMYSDIPTSACRIVIYMSILCMSGFVQDGRVYVCV